MTKRYVITYTTHKIDLESFEEKYQLTQAGWMHD